MNAILLAPVLGALVWDGPWLVIFVAFQTLLHAGFPVWTGWVLAAEWTLLVVADWGFHQWLPSRPVARSRRRLLNESWVLLWLSLLFTPILGWVMWQGAVGFDAAQRMQGFSKDVRRILVVRLSKALSVICIWALVIWVRP